MRYSLKRLMQTKSRRWSDLTSGLGFLLALFACWLGIYRDGDGYGWLAWPLFALGCLLLLIGCAFYIRAKGYHPAWALVIIPFPIVFFVFFYLPDRVPKAGVANLRGSLPLLGALLLLILCLPSAAQTNSETAPLPKAPTGIYVSVTDIGVALTVNITTNSDYQVTAESPGNVPKPKTQQGKWRWDANLREFLLTPATNSTDFPYQFRRLRVAPDSPDTLQWLPLRGADASSGAIDFVRFERKKP